MDETSIPASDVLSLIQTHLVESGLHSTSRALALESGGLARCPGLAPPAKSSLVRAASRGSWGEVLSVLHDLDVERARRGGGLDDDGDILRRRLRLRLRETGDNGDGGDDGGGGRPSSTSASPAVAAPLERAVAMAHEMAILELADLGEYELAYATLRSCSGMLDRTLPTPTSGGGDGDDGGEEEDDRDNIGNGDYSRSGDVERRIASLVSTRRSPRGDGGDGDDGAPLHPPPLDYYGGSSSSTANNSSKQGRRDFIAKALRRHVPELPTRRLVSLLQQSVKWQCHTGTYPTVARLFRRRSATAEEDNGVGGGDDVNNDEDDNDLDGGMGDRKKKEKGKKKKRKRDDGDDDGVERKFDLVLGNVIVDATGHGKDKRGRGSGPTSAVGYNASAAAERLPSRPHQTVRLGKRSYVECATFLPDGTGLVTGSSDGFVEVWGERRSTRTTVVVDGDGAAGDPKTTTAIAIAGGADDVDFEALRTSDLPYQRDDDLMMHDSPVLALDVSNDGTLLGTSSSNGTVCVWKISDGKMLRKMERAHGGIVGLGGVDRGAAVTCIRFSPDGSKVLTGGHDSTCREFGLLASRMLKEFRGHKSYVNCCGYVVLPPSALGDGGNSNRFLAVVTGSADGSVIVWDGRTAEPMREIRLPIPTSVNAIVHDKDSVVGSKSIHTVAHLHSPPNTMLVVPRTDRAYLMSYAGAVLRVYARDDVQGCEFLAAAVSPSNRWLYVAADDGKCVVFDVGTGKAEKVIRSFVCGDGRSDRSCEVSGLVCHPHRGFIGGYSNDKGQKRGILALWK